MVKNYLQGEFVTVDKIEEDILEQSMSTLILIDSLSVFSGRLIMMFIIYLFISEVICM